MPSADGSTHTECACIWTAIDATVLSGVSRGRLALWKGNTAMSDTMDRIEQFRQMAEADPRNELGHFSLGRAYLDAGMWAMAIGPLERAIEINPNMGRSYHLLGEALLQGHENAKAAEVLTRGVKVAAARGETLTQTEMVKLLQRLGASIPQEISSGGAQQPVGEGQVLCSRCGRIGAKIAKAPFRNEQGKLIHDKVCAECWIQWIAMGTKVINELRLSMNEPEAQSVFDRHMYDFLNIQP